jgi:UPF0755 protein
MKKVIAIILLGIVMLLLGVGAYGLWLNTPPENFTSNMVFSVESGDSVESIANRLERNKAIRSGLLLRGLAKLLQTEGQFKKGNYRIPSGLSTLEIHGLLQTGQQNLTKVTIPDGYTITKIAKELEKAGICSAADFIAATSNQELLTSLGINQENAEGYLFPETYFFDTPYPAIDVARHLIRQFYYELEKIAPAYKNLSAQELREKVILASIVEREYIKVDEAPLMASVFYNRLSMGMALESCATVAYVITEKEGKDYPKRILYSDLERLSPWNTYRHPGLPPTPIASPGRVALQSVFYPAKSDYLFFVLKAPGAGQHTFSRNYSDHQQASVLYFKQ